MRRIAIIGGGFSGCCLAAHLLKQGSGAEIVLVERHLPLGRGAAYGTREPEHLLNVPAAKMGFWAEAPDDFLRWARQADPGIGAAAFLPRRLYADYIAAALAGAEAESPVPLRRVEAEVVDLERNGGSWTVVTEGPSIEADVVVLATGVGEPPDPCREFRAALPSGTYLHDPWAPGALAAFPVRGDVLLLGTGLTMVDVALFLAARHPEIRIEAASPHGRLPEAHLPAPEAPWTPDGGDGGDGLLPGRPLRELVRAFRRRLAAAAESGLTWRAAFDGLRPRHVALWRGLTPADRGRFVRHLRHLWSVHRHRMPASSSETLARLRTAGRLRLHAGKACAVERAGEALRVGLRSPSREETVSVSHVINCCGQEANRDHAGLALLRRLLDRGWIAADRLRLGVETDADGALRSREDAAAPGLYAIGSLRRAAEWESTAVPELRVQAAALARLLARGA